MSTYPNPCCRCGFCCLHETCPVGQDVYRVRKQDPCPGLFFRAGGEAVCEIAWNHPEIIGVGQGCCIKARAINSSSGFVVDFSTLAPEWKRHLATLFYRRLYRHFAVNPKTLEAEIAG